MSGKKASHSNATLIDPPIQDGSIIENTERKKKGDDDHRKGTERGEEEEGEGKDLVSQIQVCRCIDQLSECVHGLGLDRTDQGRSPQLSNPADDKEREIIEMNEKAITRNPMQRILSVVFVFFFFPASPPPGSRDAQTDLILEIDFSLGLQEELCELHSTVVDGFEERCAAHLPPPKTTSSTGKKKNPENIESTKIRIRILRKWQKKKHLRC